MEKTESLIYALLCFLLFCVHHLRRKKRDNYLSEFFERDNDHQISENLNSNKYFFSIQSDSTNRYLEEDILKNKMNSSSVNTVSEWKFSQVFGERTPGEEVQDGQNLLILYLSCKLQSCLS